MSAACAALALPPAPAGAADPAEPARGCPAALENARQLVLIVTPGMNTPLARLTAYERDRPGAAWRPHGPSTPAIAGAAGLGWGRAFAAAGDAPLKTEGDRRSPAGFFPIGAPFGFARSGLPGYLRLSRGETFCVDDPHSPHYGRILPRAQAGAGTSGEDMARVGLYRFGLIIDYPAEAAQKSGSCLFIHVWRRPGAGTSGCIALAEETVRALQAFARRGEAVIGILPQAALRRYGACLPGVDLQNSPPQR